MPNFLFASFSDRFREAGEQRGRVAPAEAGVGDALAELERLARLELLAAFDQLKRMVTVIESNDTDVAFEQ